MKHFISRFRILVSFALRDVSKSRIILIFTIVSLGAAFTAVFLSAAILDGFQATLENGTIDTGGHLTIKPQADDKSIGNIDLIGQKLKSAENVQGYSVRSYGGFITRINGKYQGQGYASIGVDPMQERAASQIPNRVIAGRYLLPGDTNSVVIGVTLADALKGLMYDNKQVKVGDKIRYISPETGKGGNYTVAGILDTKYFHPDWSSYFPKEELEWLDGSRKNSEIIVKLKDPSRLEETRKNLENILPNTAVFTWREREGYVFNIITVVNFITGTISNLLIVTTFVIMSVIIFINVFQKRRQIGILKSMGANNRFIVMVYILETLTYALISFAMGYLIFLLIHSFSLGNPVPLLIGDFHTVVVEKNMGKVLLVLLTASLVGSIFPAYTAARTRIVDVLRETV